MFTSQQQECLQRFAFCLRTTSESLKLKTLLQCRHSNTEPLLYTSDPYINTSFQASSEETTPKPRHLFSHCRLLSHFSINPHKLPFPFPHPVLQSCKKRQELSLTLKVYIHACLCELEWCFPFRGTEGERTALTKMLIKCSVADKDTWECMH